MGFTVQIPIPGQPFSSEGVKVGNDISTIAQWGNGHILGSDLDPAAGILSSQLLPSAPITGAALPTGARDGDVIDYLADATNGIVWRFRYRAASSSAYKWEFIGGPPMTSAVATAENVPGMGVWSDLATVGPQLTLPLSGDYHFAYGATVSATPNASFTWFLGLNIAGVEGVDSGQDASQAQGGVSYVKGIVRSTRQNDRAAAQLAKLRYYQTGYVATWAVRWLEVTPYRLS